MTEQQILKDNLDEDFPLANEFLRKLRKQIKEINPEMNTAIHSFRTNLTKNCMYANALSDYEIYMRILYDYLHLIPAIDFVEFKIPLFGSLEGIEFRLNENNSHDLLPNDILEQCIKKHLSKRSASTGENTQENIFDMDLTAPVEEQPAPVEKLPETVSPEQWTKATASQQQEWTKRVIEERAKLLRINSE